MIFFRVLFLTLLFGAVSELFAEAEPSQKTDFEKIIEKADRVMFRDRLAIGQIDLETFPSKKGKTTLSGEKLILLTDVAFVPGDTGRFFALDLELVNSREVLNTALLDLSELVPFRTAVKYLADTGKNITETPRNDTRVSFRGISGWSVVLNQVGLEQQIVIAFPEKNLHAAVKRSLTLSQLSTLVDLLDLSQFDLKRQGAVIGKK